MSFDDLYVLWLFFRVLQEKEASKDHRDCMVSRYTASQNNTKDIDSFRDIHFQRY